MADSAGTSLAEKAIEEVRSFVFLTAYFFVCFAALLYLKHAILEAEGVSFAPWAFAAIKAVIVAKFVMVARHFEPRHDKEMRPLIVPTVYKSVAMLAILVVLMTIEELVAGYLHGRGMGQSLQELGGGTIHQKIATIVVLLLILIPFFALRALGSVIGHRTLVRMFFVSKQGAEPP
jgi:hypothetical protein